MARTALALRRILIAAALWLCCPAALGTWAVISGAVVSWKNRNILFSGGVDEGNSGGPLMQGAAAVGLVMGVEGASAWSCRP